MFESVKGFFSTGEFTDDALTQATDDVRCAVGVVLVHAARVDSHFAESEYDIISNIAEQKLHLSKGRVKELLESEEDANSLIETATSELRENFDVLLREHILALVWAVIAVDGIVKDEESEFAASLRSDLELSTVQALRARKVSEGVSIDGFKEFVEASEEVIAGTAEWVDDRAEDDTA